MRRANAAILRENYPLPTFDTLMTKLKGAQFLSRLDLKNAYHQLELTEDSREITTFITHKGLFRYKRLLFGVNSAPEIFQKTMENILAPCQNAMNYLDDIIVFGLSEEEHDRELRDKCSFKVDELKFLSHVSTTAGISADPNKVKTILEFRSPNTKEETRSFLGLVTYLGKFIPDLADTTEPLWKLIKKDIRFIWGEKEEYAFKRLKQSLAKIPMLSYFNPKNRTRLVADASPVALGAVLLQFHNDCPEVISFASKSLSAVERRYSQTEKESLALVIFQAGKLNIADSLSRLCKIEDTDSFDRHCEYNVCTLIENVVPRALTIREVVRENANDQEIMEAVENIKKDDWTASSKNKLFPFRFELCTLGNILLRGSRLVIPKSLQSRVLELGHEGHPGETAMKRRLRLKVSWPLMDREVESFVKLCRDCLLVSRPTPPVPMQRHAFPDGPWQCVAMDLLGPLPNYDFAFVIIDYYSRYQETKFVKKITSSEIIGILEEIFCRLGYPKSIKADNGRQFVSSEFKGFCDKNNIDLITSPPYWPQANGEVENMNKSILKRLQIAHGKGADYRKEVQKFTLIDKIPSVQDVSETILDSEARDLDKINKQKGKERGDRVRGAKEADIFIGDKVLLRNLIPQNKLTTDFDSTEFKVMEQNRNEVVLQGDDGRIFRRNLNHVKKIPMLHQTEIKTTNNEDILEQPSNESNNDVEETTEPRNSGLKLKLKNIGGMWRPCQ
ncbi:uncharacterized protein K02A2.6-like [Eupeodes corollae]|uniref:uncharacterized protein K02A2.6-like n=1 Tax=Eupeodes corollae TaxID=290404 RepID=UPI0024913475|nr:uncharacterized protein K02A2.6-like [Eupeodes corollae]